MPDLEKIVSIFQFTLKNTTAEFFSVHSVKALENRQFSIFHGNIENTPENVELARTLYPIEDWHFEFHNYKINLNFLIRI